MFFKKLNKIKIAFFLLFVIFSIFLPLLYAPTVAESGVKSPIPNETIMLPNQNIFDQIFNPKYVVFSQSDTILRANFVQLKRQFLFFWSPGNLSFYDVIKTGDNDLQKVKKAILDGQLTQGDNFDQDAFQKGVSASSNSNPNLAGSVIQATSDPFNKNKAEIKNGILRFTNELWVNNKNTNILNVVSMDFDDNEEKLYLALYDIYDKNSDHLESIVNGIYSYDIKNNSIKLISKFEKSEYAMVKSGGENVGILLDEGEFYLFDNNGSLKLQESIPTEDNMIYTLVSIDNRKAVFQKIMLNNKSSSQNLIEYIFSERKFNET